MLAHSRSLNPGVEHHLGDMRSIRLGRTFAAVLVHDAISYMLDADDLRRTFATAAAHLSPGGVLAVAPDHVRETFRDGAVRHTTHGDGTTELTGLEYEYDPDPGDTSYECRMIYLIRKRGGAPRVELDLVRLGLFPRQTWLELLSAAGFEVEQRRLDHAEPGHAGLLFVGVRSPARSGARESR